VEGENEIQEHNSDADSLGRPRSRSVFCECRVRAAGRGSTTFETNPVAMQGQEAPIAQSSIPDGVSAAPVKAPTPAAVNTESVAVQEAGAKKWSPVDTLTLMATMLGLAFIVVRGIAEARRPRNSQIPA